jgi:hypothetical protein
MIKQSSLSTNRRRCCNRFRTLSALHHHSQGFPFSGEYQCEDEPARPREVSLSEPGEPHVEDSIGSSEVWEVLKTMLPDPCEQRVAYLPFHCGLKPREIVRFCPQEWSSVSEIYGLRRTIIEPFLRNQINCDGDSASRVQPVQASPLNS